jgi:nicotinate-nucleotide adenylyltransferase
VSLSHGHLPRLPRHPAGLRIGLLGGSFNPPHAGHRLISLIARKQLELDRIWWIVTPGNPLKDTQSLPPQEERMAASQALMPEPFIDITGFEAEIGTRYTLDTLRYLKLRCKGVRFVWLMGADNLRQFHRWQGWREIARLMPIAVIDRPGATLKATASRATHGMAGSRIKIHAAATLASRKRQGWIFIHGPRSPLSSTAIRANLHGKS